ncbi:hypothetical protein V2J09_023369 [Rumex salicifolius]
MTGVSTSCGACKFLRRKCTSECVFAPYFRYELAPQHFGAVHKVFGASNASRLLLRLPEQCRSEAAIAMSFEALARMHDPVYGCVAYIYALQQQVAELQEEVETLSSHVASLAIGIPGNGLEFTPPAAVGIQEILLENNNNNNNGEWIMEEDVNLMTQQQPGFWREEENLGSVSEFKPFENPFEGMMMSEDIFSYFPLMQNNS